MHSSRMHTACFGGHHQTSVWRVSVWRVSVLVSVWGPMSGVSLFRGSLSRGLCPGVSVQGVLCPEWRPPPPCEQNDRLVWKHYLPATSFMTNSLLKEWTKTLQSNLLHPHANAMIKLIRATKKTTKVTSKKPRNQPNKYVLLSLFSSILFFST